MHGLFISRSTVKGIVCERLLHNSLLIWLWMNSSRSSRCCGQAGLIRQVDVFRKAHQRSDMYLAELKLHIIEERVYDLVSEFDEAIHSLWNRLNTDFGFAASLDEKMAENQQAQNQIERLLDDFQWSITRSVLRLPMVM